MYSQDHLLDIYKEAMRFHSDYQLAKHWRVQQSYITKYRKNVLWLDVEKMIMIAMAMETDPVEIIIGVEMQKKKTDKESAILKHHYFKTLQKNIGVRMSVNSGARCFFRKK